MGPPSIIVSIITCFMILFLFKPTQEVQEMCIRDSADTVRVMTKSPVGDVWEVYVCDTCSYSWRSTEEIHVHDVFLSLIHI